MPEDRGCGDLTAPSVNTGDWPVAPRSRRTRLALVEDEPEMLSLLAEVLEAAGYLVRRFGRAEALMDALRAPLSEGRVPIDIIISDLRMPGIDGLQLLGWANEHLPETPIILVTGFASRSLRERAADRFAAYVLSKPFENAELLHLVAAVSPPRF